MEIYVQNKKTHLKDCNMPKVEYTHLSNPACNLREPAGIWGGYVKTPRPSYKSILFRC